MVSKLAVSAQAKPLRYVCVTSSFTCLEIFASGEAYFQVFGAGAVGLMAVYSASITSASRIHVVDRVPE